jgi:PAS domain S-box-containing protein
MTQPCDGAEYAADLSRLLIESVVDYAIYVLDARGHVRSWNPGAERIKGYTAEEILGSHFSTFFSAEDVGSGEPERELAAAVRDGSFRGEGWRVRKDGSRFWASVVLTALHYECGELAGFAKITRDLTDRRAREEQMRQLVAETAARAAAERRREEVEQLNDLLQQQAIELECQTEEAQALTEELEEQATELETANRELAGALREAEAARELAKGSEARYRTLFDANPMPILVFDRGTLGILAVNASAVREYGYSEEELLGMTVADIRPAEDVPALQAALATARRELRRIHAARHRREDGHLMDVEVTVLPIRFGGNPDAELVLINDVTERRRLEARLRQAQKMEAVGQLAGGVAHDFNNLLTVITSYSELLLGDLPEESPMREDIEQIAEAARRAATLTRQLLAFSRQQVLRPQVLALNGVVTGLEKMLRRLVREDIEIVTALDPQLDAVKADPGQVEQVIVNLVVNARDAMASGGTLTIETANVELDEAFVARHSDAGMEPGPYVMLAVTDTGTGMTPEVQAHLFEPFFTTKAQGHGTGMGLSTVYGIVKQSGGYIWVQSEVGKGTSFQVYLPRVAATPEECPEEECEAGTLGGNETVLLVEDDNGLRAVACRVMRKYGYQVIEARNGQEALDICGRHDGRIDIVVTDMVMPEMSGAELVQRMEACNPQIRVLFMSGYTRDVVARESIMREGSGFIEKPFTPDDLAMKVREVIEARQPRRKSRRWSLRAVGVRSGIVN